MKIVHLVRSYYPKIGGIEIAVQCLAEEQAKLGHQVTVITLNPDPTNVVNEETLNGVKVQRLKARNLFYNDLAVSREKLLIEESDIVHAHSQHSLFALSIAEQFRKKSTAKIVFYFMAVDAFENSQNLIVRLFAPYYGRRNVEKALKIAHVPLVKSFRDLQSLQTMYNIRAEFIPDGVSKSIFVTKKTISDQFRVKFGIQQTRFFLFIGRVDKLKGPDILVKALKYVDDDIAAVFIGPDGGYLVETLDLAKRLGVRHRIYMLGYVDEETKIQARALLTTPNLAWWVNRFVLLLGYQPYFTNVSLQFDVGKLRRPLETGCNGEHIRVFTAKALCQLVSIYGFEIVSIDGATFELLPAIIMRLDKFVTALRPSLGADILMLAKKV